MSRAKQVAVLMYEGVDTLDLAGPFDVFAVASNWGQDFHVYTAALEKKEYRSISGITLVPTYSAEDCPIPDILVVPGGWGARTEMHNGVITAWIRSLSTQAELTISVCTGALLLAKAGLLDGLSVTTNSRAMDLLREAAPASARIVEGVRYVDNGSIIMSAGVTAGIDAALHAVGRLAGEERALDTAAKLEYLWNREAPVLNTSSSLAIRRATTKDAVKLRGLLQEAARWIHSAHGFQQWREENFTQETVDAFIGEHEVFLAERGEELAGCISVHWSYEEIWGERYHDDAGYVHRLAVSRRYKGAGIGQEMLEWAEGYIRSKGKRWLRLDCMADNPGLNRYYQSQGFVLQGRFNGGGWSAHLYERRIAD
ncbi:GNAT family N-acetyltransferase [Paenibacillus sp. 1011MAR3C5]|uniref:GNAT family N-acetyltransferase n=1 Tax=Paenibacillus sp. 1011MAR3C5 TaxID=1675787 RepID=UPI000E6B5C22|nr:GNAT family N-acetyltransferase [Paenibacillus sp. 1011MAR3C5]RJE85130.1 GNAT family N-acetyltransferase [Paenibacillus sp. 1011MAR3C5]